MSPKPEHWYKDPIWPGAWIKRKAGFGVHIVPIRSKLWSVAVFAPMDQARCKVVREVSSLGLAKAFGSRVLNQLVREAWPKWSKR